MKGHRAPQPPVRGDSVTSEEDTQLSSATTKTVKTRDNSRKSLASAPPQAFSKTTSVSGLPSPSSSAPQAFSQSTSVSGLGRPLPPPPETFSQTTSVSGLASPTPPPPETFSQTTSVSGLARPLPPPPETFSQTTSVSGLASPTPPPPETFSQTTSVSGLASPTPPPPETFSQTTSVSGLASPTPPPPETFSQTTSVSGLASPTPPPPETFSQTTSVSGLASPTPPPPETFSLSTSVSGLASPSQTGISAPVPENIAGELIEIVRVNTNLSYDKSRLAVGTTLSHIGSSIPAIANIMETILKKLAKEHKEGDTMDNLEGSYDAERLEVIFSELTSCKDDSQQRSWALHEDEAIILEYIQELTTILNDANPNICKAVISRDHYESLHSLVVYYQMEHRLTIRIALLKAFGAVCALESAMISNLVCSILPVELARDMQTNPDDFQRLCYSALVSTMLLSTGESLPYTHYHQLNEAFVEFLLEQIEKPLLEDEDEQIADLFVKLILAFNLHFQVPSDNTVMKVLAYRKNVKTFSEKVMILVNRGDDPVRMFDHKPKPPDSLLKFLGDIFSSSDTSDIFYSSDLLVLIDIVVRQLSDLSPGDEVRTENLSLIHSIVTTTDYSEHRHRCAELGRCFNTIAVEEYQESEPDRMIVHQIWKDFPQFFSESS
ncbi:NCK-interacting protein with SH3 domain-like [Glandiceps talaboti]